MDPLARNSGSPQGRGLRSPVKGPMPELSPRNSGGDIDGNGFRIAPYARVRRRYVGGDAWPAGNPGCMGTDCSHPVSIRPGRLGVAQKCAYSTSCKDARASLMPTVAGIL